MSANDFNALVDLAMKAPGLAAMRPVVEKEILHYDIFYALNQAGLLKGLVFQGGTSLRLCYGSNRFSEDLDFAGGRDFNAERMREIKSCIERHIGTCYGLNVSVREPSPGDGQQIERVSVAKWLVVVETSPERPDIPRQTIKLKIANIPAYTRELVPLRVNYEFLEGMNDILVPTETMSEIVADNVVAFPTSLVNADGSTVGLSSKKIRHRDIWDIAWLSSRRAALDTTMAANKVTDYGIVGYDDLLDHALNILPSVVRSSAFIDQMKRFIDAETLTKTLAAPGYQDYLIGAVGSTLAAMRDAQSLASHQVKEVPNP